MPGVHIRMIDPAMLDFIVADLAEEDFVLAEASEELLRTRLEELKPLIHLQVEQLSLDDDADETGLESGDTRAVPLIPIRHARTGALLYLTEELCWAVGVPKRRTRQLSYFSRNIDAWKHANFKDLVIALDTQITQANRHQRDRDRDQRVDAIKALKNGDGCLNAAAGKERERPLISERA